MRINSSLPTFTIVAVAGGVLAIALLLGSPRETPAAQPAAARADCSFCKEVLILHHSHVDVGYTHPQSMYRELQMPMMTALAELHVTSGGTKTVHPLKAGVRHLRIPFAIGPQHFTVYRDGKRILAKDGEPIMDRIERYDFFPTSGFAYARQER